MPKETESSASLLTDIEKNPFDCVYVSNALAKGYTPDEIRPYLMKGLMLNIGEDKSPELIRALRRGGIEQYLKEFEL